MNVHLPLKLLDVLCDKLWIQREVLKPSEIEVTFESPFDQLKEQRRVFSLKTKDKYTTKSISVADPDWIRIQEGKNYP
jgi:hypothetical protein